MEMIKKISIRIFVLLLLFVVMNEVYKATFWRSDMEKEGFLLLDLATAQDSADVIYFGESSNFTTHESDSIEKSISEFAATYYPSLVFKNVQRGAIHAHTYLNLIKNIPENSRVKTLIITMNLRSFGADWIHSKLETPLMKAEIMGLTPIPLLNRFLLALNFYDNKTEEEREQEKKRVWQNEKLRFPWDFKYDNVAAWDKALADGSYKNADGSWDMPRIELACHNVKTFAFQIDTLKNPRIKDFDEIVKVAQKKRIHLVFNLLAENAQYADSLAGKELVWLLQSNRDLLVKRYASKGAIVVDNLECVEGVDFIDQHWTTEHYKQRGRERIAKNLADSLKKLYPTKFKSFGN